MGGHPKWVTVFKTDIIYDISGLHLRVSDLECASLLRMLLVAVMLLEPRISISSRRWTLDTVSPASDSEYLFCFFLAKMGGFYSRGTCQAASCEGCYRCY
jgi:hypothetical protein